MLGFTPLGAAPLGSAGGTGATYFTTLDAGFFRVLGDGEVFNAGYILALGTGAVALAGLDANVFKATYTTRMQPGALHLGGSQAYIRTYGTTLGEGDYSLLLAMVPSIRRNMPMGLGSYAITRGPSTFLKGFSAPLDPGHFNVTGLLTGAASRALSLAVGVVVVTGPKNKLTQKKRVILAEDGPYAVTGSDATFALGYSVALGVGTFALVKPPVALVAHRALSLDPAAIALTVLDLTLRARHKVTLRPGTFNLHGDWTFSAARGVAMEPRALTVVAADLRLAAQRHVTLSVGRFTRVGSPMVLSRSRVLPLDPGHFMTTLALTPRLRRALGLGPDAVVLAGSNMTFGQPSRAVALEQGVYMVGSRGADLEFSGSLAGLHEGLRWEMISTITVEAEECVT